MVSLFLVLVLSFCVSTFGGFREVFSLAAHAHQQGDFPRALLLYQDVLLLQNLSVVHNNVGGIYHTILNFSEAEKHYRLALSLQPVYPEVHYNLCHLFAEGLEQLEEGLAHCEIALQQRPDYGKAAQMAGNILQDLNRMDEAAKLFQQTRRPVEHDKKFFRWDEQDFGALTEVAVGSNQWRKMTRLDESVFLVEGLLSADECDHVIKLAIANRLKPSITLQGRVTAVRQSTTTFLDVRRDPVLTSVATRVGRLTGLPGLMEHSEHLQVVHYQSGGFYKTHQDTTESLRRFLTVLLYLNEPAQGGGTVFPYAQGHRACTESCDGPGELCQASCTGIQVEARKGRAVLFYNYHLDNRTINQAVHHAGCRVIEGEKFVANFWVNF